MGLVNIYANTENIVYKIILNHDDVSTGVINYLNECGKKIPTAAWSQEEKTSAFGGKDITSKYDIKCNVTALSLVNHLKRKLGYKLFAVTPILTGGYSHQLLYILDFAPK